MGEALLIVAMVIAGFLWVRRHWPRKAGPQRSRPWLVADGEFSDGIDPQEDW
jgi:hypothetical protein